MKPDDLGTTNSSKLQFPVVMSGTSYGYKNTSGTFVAFRGDSTGTYTYAANSTGGTVDMGARNNYRYVNAANVYAKGKADGGDVPFATMGFTRNNDSANNTYISCYIDPSNLSACLSSGSSSFNITGKFNASFQSLNVTVTPSVDCTCVYKLRNATNFIKVRLTAGSSSSYAIYGSGLCTLIFD